MLCSFLCSLLFIAFANGFITFNRAAIKRYSIFSASSDNNLEITAVDVPLGEGYKSVEFKFRPIFQSSSFFTVTYNVPFSLNVEKPPKGFPAPIVTKDGENANGEKKGDVLRATTSWSQGFNAAGATSDIMMFAGNLKWRKSVFETAGAPWQQIVDALLSNTVERSKTVTLVFERETPDIEVANS
jgi:hypothetical protein